MHHACGAAALFKRFDCTICAAYGHRCGRRIQEYSLWALKKDPRALRHMKLNFHITWEDNAILLPLDGSAQAFVQHFDRKDWRTSIAQMEEQEKAKAGATISLLHGQWMELLEYL